MTTAGLPKSVARLGAAIFISLICYFRLMTLSRFQSVTASSNSSVPIASHKTDFTIVIMNDAFQPLV